MSNKNAIESKEDSVELEVNSILRESSSALRSPLVQSNIIYDEDDSESDIDDYSCLSETALLETLEDALETQSLFRANTLRADQSILSLELNKLLKLKKTQINTIKLLHRMEENNDYYIQQKNFNFSLAIDEIIQFVINTMLQQNHNDSKLALIAMDHEFKNASRDLPNFLNKHDKLELICSNNMILINYLEMKKNWMFIIL